MVSIARIAARGLLVTGSAASLGTGFMVTTQPEAGFSRSMRFWAGIMPCYSHYKYIEWKQSRLPADTEIDLYEPLHDKYSPIMEQLTLNMQGFYFKLAQVVSTRDEFVPDIYMDWMKKLQGQSPRILPADEARAVVTGALGIGSVDEVFEDWEDTPIGAASIGQVHRAKVRATGEEVAVKIMMPGVEEKFRNDIDTVETFCKYLMPQNAPFFSEIKKQFATEFDYEGEAANLKQVNECIEKSPWKSKVAIPKAYPELCRKTVLTMSYLPGETLIDGVRGQFKRHAERIGRDFEEMEKEQVAKLKSGEIQRKGISESSKENWWIHQYLWLRDLSVNSVIFLGNWTVKPFISRGSWEYVHSERPINLAAIMETLLRVHAYEIFFAGNFNADPHPGNILLMPDGRLGLVDYGQFKRMSFEDRVIYAKLIIALHRDDKEEVVRLMHEEVGYKSKHSDPNVTWRLAAFWNDRDTKEITNGMNVHQFAEWMDKTDPAVHVNDEYILAGRCSVLLRGIANAFALRLRVSDFWHIDAQQFLKENEIEY